jgi:membrane protease YdiL (CAAX protease family)
MVLLGVIALAAGFDPATAGGMSSPLLFAAGLGVYLMLLLAVYWFAVRRPGSSWQLLGVRAFSPVWLPLLPLLLLAQLLGMVIINTQIAIYFTGGNFENPQIEAITGGMTLTARDLLLLLLLIAVIAPIAEELFFRGMLHPVLRQRWSPRWAIVLNALIFALIHFIPILIPGLFFVGLMLTWVRERTQSVIPGAILHCLQNGLVVLAIYAASQGILSA